jgi:uncharacterized phiE125 gp8 family phage protein
MYSVQRIRDGSSSSSESELAVSLAEAKKEVEVATAITYHDDHLTRLIKAATQQAMVRSGRQLLSCRFRLTIDAFPTGNGRIALPYPPLQSVDEIRYYDAAGVQQTLSADVYRVLTAREPGEICLQFGQSWPTVYDEPDAVEVEYTAGVADTAAELEAEDEWYRQAILILVKAYWLRDHSQPYDAEIRAADLILEAHRCGDDFVQFWDA